MERLRSHFLSTRFHSRMGKALVIALVVVFINACADKKSAEEHLEDAIAFSQNGDPKAAVVALKNAIQASPELAKARFELGRISLELSAFEEAAKELSLALEYGHPENEVIPPLAEALTRSMANVALADLSYDPSILTIQEQLEVGARRVAALVDLNKIDEASKLVSELLSIDEDSTYKGMVETYQSIIDQDYPVALNKAERVLEGAPQNRDIMNLTARLYMLTGDVESAINLYENYLEVAEDDLRTKFALIDILIQQQQAPRAEKYIDELLEKNPENGLLTQLKAEARAASEDYEAALMFAEKSINSGRAEPKLRLIAGFAAYNLQDYENVVKHVSVVSDVLEDDHPAIKILTDSKLQLGMGADAADLLARIEGNDADAVSLRSRTGYELVKAGDTESAQAIIDKLENNSPTSDDLLRLGVLKLSLNNLDGLQDLEKAVEVAPESVEAKAILANAYISADQPDKALEFARKWQQSQPDLVDPYLLEADVLISQEAFDKAKPIIQKAANIDAQNTLVQLANVRFAIATKDLEGGLQKVESLLEKEPDNDKALSFYYTLARQSGDAKPAISAIKRSYDDNKDNEALNILYASVLMVDGQVDETLKVLDNVDANRLTPSTYWRLKGAALFTKRDLPNSYKHYSQWVDYFPNRVEPNLGLLNVLDLQGNFTEAEKVAGQFLSENENLQISMMHANFLAMVGKSQKAKDALSSLNKDYLNLPYVRGVQARIAVLEGRGGRHVEDAKLAYEAKKSADNLYLYVTTLDRSGKNTLANKVIQTHLLELPGDIRSKALLAQRVTESDPDSALQYYEEMLAVYPNSPPLLNNAAYLHFQANNIEKAFQYSTKSLSADPANVSFADTHAQVLLKRGEIEKAVEVYNTAVTDELSNEEIILNYIEALFQNNNTFAAKRRVQQFKSRVKTQGGKDRLFDLQIKYSD